MGHLREPFVQWAFGSFHLDPQQRVLLRVIDQGEETIPLGSRALDILILLVRRRSALVTKNELIEAVWPGVAVEDNNLTVQMSALRRALGDGQNGARLIETVSGRGYRFVAPVIEIIESPADAPPDLIDQPTTPIASDRPRFALKSRHAAFAFVVLAATLVGVIMIGQAGWPDTRPALSIVVLPLATGDGDPAHDYIAEAITDDLTTQMASIEGAFVIGRETANAFRGQTNSRRTADQLGVRYLLEGSVHSVGTRIRVNAGLIAADSGATIWADRFDSEIAGLPAAQDEAVNRIAMALGSRLVDSEAQRVAREHPTDADAFDLVLRARSILNLPRNSDRYEQATILLRQALQREPRSVSAMALLGSIIVMRWIELGDPAGRDERFAEARDLLARATALEPRDFGVLWLKAQLLRVDEAWEDAATAFREALAIRPGWSSTHNQLALCELMLGRPEQALSLLETALRLDPKAPSIHTRYALMGKALLTLGRNEEAADWLRRAVQAVSPPHDLYHEALAASLARSDHRAQAEEQLRSHLRLAPGMTVSMVRHLIVPSASRAYWNALADGLSLAGLRDHAGVETRVEAPPGSHPGGEHEPPPGVTRVATDELHRMLNQGKAPLLLQMFNADVAIPGTVRVSPDAVRTNASSAAIKALDRRLEQLTGGDRDRTVVTVAWNIESARSQLLAALIASLGYKQVYFYAEGLEAWIAHDLPVEKRES